MSEVRSPETTDEIKRGAGFDSSHSWANRIQTRNSPTAGMTREQAEEYSNREMARFVAEREARMKGITVEEVKQENIGAGPLENLDNTNDQGQEVRQEHKAPESKIAQEEPKLIGLVNRARDKGIVDTTSDTSGQVTEHATQAQTESPQSGVLKFLKK